MPIRILIVDDHSMIRQGLQMYFEDDSEVEIVGEARNGEEALRLAEDLGPQVVLMDLLMPVVDGCAATKALRRMLPHTHIIAMTSVVEEVGVHRAIAAGAISYVLKDTRPDELRDAILAAAQGRVRFPPESAGRLMQDVPTPDVDPQTLPEDVRQALQLLAAGRSTAEISRELGCGQGEVDERIDAAMSCLNIAGRAQAVLYATRQGLVPADLRPYLV